MEKLYKIISQNILKSFYITVFNSQIRLMFLYSPHPTLVLHITHRRQNIPKALQNLVSRISIFRKINSLLVEFLFLTSISLILDISPLSHLEKLTKEYQRIKTQNSILKKAVIQVRFTKRIF